MADSNKFYVDIEKTDRIVVIYISFLKWKIEIHIKKT
jgi:hypothetical protein